MSVATSCYLNGVGESTCVMRACFGGWGGGCELTRVPVLVRHADIYEYNKVRSQGGPDLAVLWRMWQAYKEGEPQMRRLPEF